MIIAEGVTKEFRIARKKPGLSGSIQGFFHREWETKHALRGVTLSINEGEIVGLVGANGAGKTTLVKILSGIIYPTAGRVSVLGHEPWKRPVELRRQIALLMGQKNQLWWDLPAADCFLLLKHIYKIPHHDFEDTLGQLSSELGVERLLDVQLRRLSLGERMKMELIGVLLHRPRVLFLDEPTIGLDITAQRAVRRFLLRYAAEHRPAIILTSHYMEDIEELCRRIVIIREGEFVYDGLTKDLVASYATTRIIRFVPPADVAREQLERDLRSFPSVELDEGLTARITVERSNVGHAISALLTMYPDSDFSVAEGDISNVVASIMQSGRRNE